MFCIQRHRTQTIVLNTSDGPIEIMVTEGRARLSVKAPASVQIMRGETLELAKAAQKVLI